VLRSAAQRQISGEELPTWLKENGGVRKLDPCGKNVYKERRLLLRAYLELDGHDLQEEIGAFLRVDSADEARLKIQKLS
jgi:hypothetical protein